jgi:DNA topoisomerase-1
MERELDDVEEGRRSWTEFLHTFYGDFKETMKKAEAEMDRVQKPLEEMDETCPECGRNLVIRTGRFGRFISCSGFPECSYRRSFVNKTGALCPICHGDLVERKTKQKKRVFYGCANYPTCNFAIWEKPIPEPCPKCGGLMVVTKPGQDPVCYEEVIVPQRNAEARPQTDSEKKATRKKAVGVEGEDAAGTTRTTRRTSTRKRVVADGEGEDGIVKATKAKKATPRATTTRRTTARAKAPARTTRRASATAGTTKRKTSTTAKKTTGGRGKTKAAQ